jgi:5-hydroxyisourate hydrolase-like protein (transthyretin family)
MMKISRLTVLGLVVFFFLAIPAFAGQQKAPSASINLVVLRQANGKPVRNAEIVLHPVDTKGKQKQEGLELKTHEDGKAGITGIAYGKWRIQVIAPGFKTYGEDYDINQPSHEITIKLQKPSEQYSIYK